MKRALVTGGTRGIGVQTGGALRILLEVVSDDRCAP
jgi:NAD(P)-dependent dehydrogenase (short-subunit alcohol dehydrogenase family)